ncbi:gamma-glutamyltransferase [Fodinibius sediminis]|uniref:Glutathione hydrolase proenzyme n=1 Tax=Fodinibius sediminis TaxID=1214077 RepID=A0A521DJV5_9BACT|nr:gamma-glutamyltransferase [Fodinibius sediminis]SMO72013.1 gamma-glutamyltranspeptidase / glutathione hydrolase [Fodinibius sediminis]
MKLLTSLFNPKTIRYYAVLLVFLFLGCSPEPSGRDLRSSHSDRGKRLVAEQAMVSSAHPLASEAGLEMLEKGGNAVDAAVATAFALNVVEPNMSGIGGGGGMLIWKQEQKQADYVDFYTAKRGESYKGLDYEQYEKGAFNLLSTGIPGTVDGLLQALERHGTMSRKEVMKPAINYAREGFPVYLTLAQFIRNSEEKLNRYEGARKIFYPDGEPLDVGEMLRQPELARTLQNISDRGAAAFYEGQNADDIVEVLNEAGNPATLKDLAEYEPQWDKRPLRGNYKDYDVISAPLPQTGFYIIQALNILESFDLARKGLPTESAEAFDIISSTMRLSSADRRAYVSDPNWEEIPVDGLISEPYASERRKLVGTGSVREEVTSGRPGKSLSLKSPMVGYPIVGDEAESRKARDQHSVPLASAGPGTLGYDEAGGTGETTHISVVDPRGNAVSLTTTLSHVFGSGAWVNGFMLNNSGFNFSHLESKEEWRSSHPYRIRASTISPTIILDENEQVRLVIGAPGGGRIPTAILQNILYVVEYNLDPLDAVEMPRIFPASSSPEVQIEKGFAPDVLAEVRRMGYDLQALSEGYARLYLVSSENGRLIGVADPRHDGEVRGF